MKTLYGGLLSWQQYDEYGVVQVIEHSNAWSLHFGNDVEQSRIFKHDPAQMAFSYIQIMLSTLVFMPQPQRILILGLGGGSLLHFLARHYPDSRIVAVEKRPAVIEAAYRMGHLPHSSHIQILAMDALEYLEHNNEAFDLTLVDLYSAHGMAPVMASSRFYHALQQSLKDDGMAVLNLWKTQMDEYIHVNGMLERHFAQPGYVYPVPERGNVISLYRSRPLQPQIQKWRDHARHLRQLPINFSSHLQLWLQHNSRLQRG